MKIKRKIVYITPKLLGAVITLLVLVSCYKLEDLTPNFEDASSTVVYDLPGDTLATDGWEERFETGDLYLRQRYYNARWTDSIRFVSQTNEVINAAEGADVNPVGKTPDEWKAEVLVRERAIRWLKEAISHPATVSDNEAYLNTSNKRRYIRRSNSWYQMDIIPKSSADNAENITINWRGFLSTPPQQPKQRVGLS